ncbi:polyadenylate-binding protein-interacting protein 5 isoform X3 [Gossypium australe]|uniref:Polyadenylate-binding protein-interacting protein 5 isoform X3 n=1 Tax=Gossypium australe TaxID=47621 RepID=A0A5B6W543_9ROSI|nr:polyadenylate-binding protein-interacting protein 5 isoform X3 [Gossypium australe]
MTNSLCSLLQYFTCLVQMHTVESSETLPDTLDIGDVSESGSSATCVGLKLKNMAGETSASSSGGAESAVAS